MADDSDDQLRGKGEEGGEGGAPAPKTGEDEIIVPIRKTSLHNIQGYATRKAQEVRDKSGKGDEGTPPAGDKDQDELTPEATSRIAEEVDRHVKPLREALASRADEDELRGFYTREPEAEKHDKVIKKYMQVHPTATVEMIYHHIAFDEAEKSG